MKTLTFIFSLFLPCAMALGAERPSPLFVTEDTPASILEIRIMVKAGSAHDPVGKEGLANVTAGAILVAGFGKAISPTTKEVLADLTFAWGEDSYPSYVIDKETTTFVMRVPREVLSEYLEKVLQPMFGAPLFSSEEVNRIATEATEEIKGGLRRANVERLGLEAMDNYLFDGTSYAHVTSGTVQGLKSLTRTDAARFYSTYYRPSRMIVGVNTKATDVSAAISEALSSSGKAFPNVRPFPITTLKGPTPIHGRELAIVAMPNAGGAGLHAAFPLDIRRDSPEFWPLYVGNIHFGTHRDSFGLLYNRIRNQRGYNYGDYSYVEHFQDRPFNMFPPTNAPRLNQYFTIWIRPVATQYAHHLLKAMTSEFETFLHTGLTDEEVENAKNKAKVLYLSLAESSSRNLAGSVDDAYYKMNQGYLKNYLTSIDAVTTDEVNEAIRKHLRSEDMKFLIVTEASEAEKLADDIRKNQHSTGKSPKDYSIEPTAVGADTLLCLTKENLEKLQRDSVWSSTFLNIDPDRVCVYPVDTLFETGAFATVPSGGTSKAITPKTNAKE